MYRFLLYGVGILCLLNTLLYGDFVPAERGTLIVTYQTQSSADLDRIRFWLINPQEERVLYPKKEGFVSNSHVPGERTVVIPDLPLGDYRIEFLVPDTVGPYEEVPLKTVSLTAAAVVKLDQTIRLRSVLSKP